MRNEKIPHKIKDNDCETNKFNFYQGSFRKTLLDLDLLDYAISKDIIINQRRKESGLILTCLDHVINDYRFTYKKEIQ